MGHGSFRRLADIRRAWPTTLMVLRLSRSLELDADIRSGAADMVSIGSWALADPDFVERLRSGAGALPAPTPLRQS